MSNNDPILGPGERWKIITGDSTAVLRDMDAGSVAVSVTSPPYNTLPATSKVGGLHAERKSGINKWVTKAAEGYFDQRPEPEYQAWILDVVGHLVRVSRGLVWVNHKIRYRDGVALHPVQWLAKWPIYAEVIWDRGGSMALNCKRYAPSHEILLALGSPHVWNDHLNTTMSVWRIAPQLSEEHPCPYPVELVRRPIESSSSLDDIILDPFTGSGTTGVAALRTGRRFIGIEIDDHYATIARRRCAEAEQAFALFEPPAKEVQGTLL